MKSLENHRKAALIVAGCSLVLTACGGGKSTPMLDDGGMSPTGDGGAPDSSVSDFDPSVSYPGEGDACRLSMECGDRQICVDDACVRHERIDPSEVRLGEWRVSSEAAGRSIGLGSSSGGNQVAVVIPGRDHPMVVSTRELEEGCRLTRIDRDWRTLDLDGVECLSVESTEDGGVLVGGFRRSDEAPLLVRLSPELVEIDRVELDRALIVTAVTPGLEVRSGGVTSVLVDGSDVLVAVGVFSSNVREEHDETVVIRLAADGSQTVELARIAGGRGWLVRDARGVSVVTTVWPWRDDFSRASPDLRSAEFRYLRRSLDSADEIAEYVGSAETAWLNRPSRTQWSVVLHELEFPECEIKSFGPGGAGVVGLVEESSIHRNCVDAAFEHDFSASPNRGRSSGVPFGFHGVRSSRGDIWVLDVFREGPIGELSDAGFVDQLTGERSSLESLSDTGHTVQGNVLSRYGTTVEIVGLLLVAGPSVVERRLERL